MSILKILTYNVCWECIKGVNKGSAKILGEKCKNTKMINGTNLCFRNISYISSYTNFDLIGLQEASLKLANNIINKLGKHYKMITSKSCMEYSIIIYNSKKLKKIGKNYSGYIEECGRPYIYQKFIYIQNNNEILVGNFHGPHLKYDWVTKYINKSNTISNSKTKIIIFGDFNRELNKKYKTNKTNKIIKQINTNIKTCALKNKLKNIKNKSYQRKIDNILLSNNIKLLQGPVSIHNNNTLLPKDINFSLSNYSSDHRPIAAKIMI